MRWTTLLLTVLCYQVGLVDGDTYWAFSPTDTDAGALATFAVVTFDLANTAAIFGANVGDRLDITHVGTIDTWHPWNKFAPIPSITAANQIPAGPGGPLGGGPLATTTGTYTVATDNGIALAPTFLNADARVLRLTVTTAAATLFSADWGMRIFIPWFLLARNPSSPGVMVTTSLGGQVNAVALTTMTVQTPWITTSASMDMSTLQFISLVPSSTIADSVLTGLTVAFQPGRLITGDSIITIHVHGGSQFLNSQPTSTPTLSVGTTCNSNAASLYCCGLSTVTTTVPSLANAAANTQWGTTPFPNGQVGWSSIQVTLKPTGCIIPANKQIAFTVPSAYLNKNPAVASFKAQALAASSVGFRHVDSWMETSEEPLAVIVQRLSSSWAFTPLLIDAAAVANPIVGFPAAGGAAGGIAATAEVTAQTTINWAFGPSSYVVGLTRLQGFTAAPNTVAANVAPSSLTVTFTTVAAIGLPLANGITNSIPAIVITASNFIFRPNIGEPGEPRGFAFITPKACSDAGYFTDSWGTLYVFPIGINVGNAAGCTIPANTVVQFQIPEAALLPNPATGTAVMFDIRVMPSITQNVGAAALTAANTAGNVVTTVGDAASLMNQFGYFTTAGSAANLNYVNTDIYNSGFSNLRPVGLVNYILSTSPTTQGVSANGNTTYYKIPQSAWPQSPASFPGLLIRNWGLMPTVPMLAVVNTYPLTEAALQGLQIPTSICGGLPLAFLFSVDRFTTAGVASNIGNPIDFNIQAAGPVSHVFVVTTANSAGTALVRGWAQAGNGNVYVDSSDGGVFVGCGVESNPSSSSQSDDAWLGFLAFLILPVCCCICCCVAALLFLKKRRSKTCCNPIDQYPVVPDYAIPMAPVATEYVLPMVAHAPTPVFGY